MLGPKLQHCLQTKRCYHSEGEKAPKKAQEKRFWEFIWFKTKVPSWNQEEERLSRLTQVLHMGLLVPV